MSWCMLTLPSPFDTQWTYACTGIQSVLRVKRITRSKQYSYTDSEIWESPSLLLDKEKQTKRERERERERERAWWGRELSKEIPLGYLLPHIDFVHYRYQELYRRHKTRLLVAVEARRPPLTDVGTGTAFRLDQRKHFRKSKHLLRSEVSWCDQPV